MIDYHSIAPWHLKNWMLSFWAIALLGTLLIGCSESMSLRSTDVPAKLMTQAQIRMDKVAIPANLSVHKSFDPGIDEPGDYFYYNNGDETVIVVRFPLSGWSLEWSWYWKGQDLILCRDRLISDREGGTYVPPRNPPSDRYLYFQNNRLAYSTDVPEWRMPETLLREDEVLRFGEFFRKHKANDDEDIHGADIPGWMAAPE